MFSEVMPAAGSGFMLVYCQSPTWSVVARSAVCVCRAALRKLYKCQVCLSLIIWKARGIQG